LIRLAIASQKGGVGKTTLALNLGYSFAKRGHRTLVVDTDPQGSVALSLARRQNDFRGLSNYLAGEVPLGDVVLPTKLATLGLVFCGTVPAVDIDAFEDSLGGPDGLPRLLGDAEGNYDLVLFDTPSGLGGTTRKVLEHSTHVVTPIQAEPLAFRSLGQMLELLAALRERGSDVTLVGLVLVMLQVRNDLSVGVAQELWSQFPGDLLIEASIPRDGIFLSAGAAGVPIALLGRNPPPISGVFDQIAAELEPRIGVRPEEANDGPIDLLV
jgi:chromosome partitioning protein